MNIFQAIILGVVQGLTEFLPVSSSGHLVMIEQFFNLGNELFLTLCLHFGTLLAVIVVYAKDLWYIIRHPLCDLSKKLIIATIPTVIIVILFRVVAAKVFASNFYIIGFAITAFLLLYTQNFAKQKNVGSVSTKSSIIIGIAQGLACLPGVSRSGSTICAGLLCGEEKQQVARFSFLLSIPIIIASCVYEMLFEFSFASIEIMPLIVGMFCSFLSGIVAIKFMIKIVNKSKLSYFAIYLFALSFLLVLCNFIR